VTERGWAVFLDRDGVLVEAVMRGTVAASPRSMGELRIARGAVDAIRLLHAVGASCLVVTNQPDVGRGDLSPELLHEMHDALRAEIGFDDVLACTHDGRDGCDCRKPNPGMLRELARRHRVDLARSWMVGDRWVDVAAGAAVGARTVLIDRSYSWAATSAGTPAPGLEPDHRVSDVLASARLIAAFAGHPVPVGEGVHGYSRNISAEDRTP
jgi:D-glycero-D-manno-heptose 1,7-bisphosphate phosphatase